MDSLAESAENSTSVVGQVVEKDQTVESQSPVITEKHGDNPVEVRVEDVSHNSAPVMPEIPEENYRWIVEIAAVTKQSDYERLIVQLQKDGFHPVVRVESLPSGVEVFRLEIRETEMNEALVRMSQLKRLKYVDQKNLVMKPGKDSSKK